MVVCLVWQQLASFLSFVAVMAQLVVAVTVAVVASSPLVEDKMLLPPTLAYHTSADTNNKLVAYYGGRGKEGDHGVGRGSKAGETCTDWNSFELGNQ